MSRKQRIAVLALSLVLILAVALPTFAQTGGGTVSPTGGSLSIANVDNLDFGSPVIGADSTATASGAIAVNDYRGTGSGWKITAQLSADFTGATHTSSKLGTLSVTGATVQSGSAVKDATLVYSVDVPVSPTTAATVFKTEVDSGTAENSISLDYSLGIPTNAYAETYSATLTYTASALP